MQNSSPTFFKRWLNTLNHRKSRSLQNIKHTGNQKLHSSTVFLNIPVPSNANTFRQQHSVLNTSLSWDPPKEYGTAQPSPILHKIFTQARVGERKGLDTVLSWLLMLLFLPQYFMHTPFLHTEIIDHCYLVWIHRELNSPGANVREKAV